MLVEWNYCLDGNARGVPMAVIHPGHGPVPYQFDLDGADGFGMVADSLSVVVNLLLYSLFPGLPVAAPHK